LLCSCTTTRNLRGRTSINPFCIISRRCAMYFFYRFDFLLPYQLEVFV
jgi:hypothetical protein